MSRMQHGYPWQSLANLPYHSSFSGVPLWSIPYPHRADQCTSLLVGTHWRAHVLASTGGRHLWVHPCFSSSVPRVLSILLGWFGWYVAGGRTAVFSWGVVSTSCSGSHTAFLCSSHLVYSLVASLGSRWCSHTAVLTRQRHGRIVSLTCLWVWISIWLIIYL